jgi:hypothetical protein
MRHWYGFPSYRLEKLQREWGIPLPDATQSDLITQAIQAIEPVFYEIFHHAARADLLIFDDTSARIQSVIRDHKKHPEQKRYGSHVTGIIARTRERTLQLYRVGTLHAGENIEDLLAVRPGDLPPPLQMTDASAVNTDHRFETVVAYCLQHARGNFDDIAAHFPLECGRVLDLIGQVYHNEKVIREGELDDQARLRDHQKHSAPIMTELFAYLEYLVDQRQVEDSSRLGKAIAYVLTRKTELTRFLHIPGAPLDSNAVERALKSAVLIRKNSLFYNNEVSAYRAGILMTLAGTCNACGIDPLRYLTALIEAADADSLDPAEMVPWSRWASKFANGVG